MATEFSLWTHSAKAENDLSACQYHIVELSAADQVDVCDGAGDIPYGVLQNKPEAGESAAVMFLGISKVYSDGSGTGVPFDVGDWVGTNASGHAIKKSADKDIVLGQALDASTALGTIVRVKLTGPFYISAT